MFQFILAALIATAGALTAPPRALAQSQLLDPGALRFDTIQNFPRWTSALSVVSPGPEASWSRPINTSPPRGPHSCL